MTGLEKITARLESEAVADAARITEEAEAQCAVIRCEGEVKAQKVYAQRIREGTKAAEDRVQRLAKAADMEARKSILSAKQALVDETFERVNKKLSSLTGDDYIAFLAGQAVKGSVTGKEEIVLSSSDRDAYGAKVVKKANAALSAAGKAGGLKLADQAGDFEGGLLLKDGNISINCTIAALMAQAREEMTSFAAAELFA